MFTLAVKMTEPSTFRLMGYDLSDVRCKLDPLLAPVTEGGNREQTQRISGSPSPSWDHFNTD